MEKPDLDKMSPSAMRNYIRVLHDILKDQFQIIAELHKERAALRYDNHRYDSAHKEPLRFLAWVLLRDVWPFSTLWTRVGK